ncbi:MAG: 4-hydroxythreonine-4-phosphate dehydrogenase PdxA [Gemmatimonadota bacterium]|nr:4-hydroxythreonine-4-phosphate dehydrogenase PdxA [Gemmatimonadota bacterium]
MPAGIRSGGAGKAPLLAITMGDARGIGPEVLLKSLAHPDLAGIPAPVIFGLSRVLEAEASLIWKDRAGLPDAVRKALETVVDVCEPEEKDRFPAGGPAELRRFLAENPGLCGQWAGRAVKRAVERIAASGARGLVTAPLDKSALNKGGYLFPGHTEMLAHLAGDIEVSMMLTGGNLRVVPATTHIPLASVPGTVTVKLLVGQCRIIDRSLKEMFGIQRPKIAVCGLNPHLGDGGLAGDEDLRVCAPAVDAARSEGIDANGPFAADTVFVRAVRGEFDVVLAMYHDQAMIPIKMHAFGLGINVTLGLPFVRTSPDHGVALDIAGTGAADQSSMVEAIKLAARLCRTRQDTEKEG